MLDNIKKRLLHFETDGRSIVSDFVETRQRRTGLLRRVVHLCFYVHCAAALVCAAAGFICGGALTGALLTLGGAASVAASLMAVPGDGFIGTVSYVLDIAYAVICFCLGGMFLLCGGVMTAAALASLCSFLAGYFRGFLLSFPPSGIRPENYTLTGAPPMTEEKAPEIPLAPAPKSELLLVAEQVTRIMSASRRDDNGKERAENHEA